MHKVVVVTADPPVPLTGGGSRTYYFTEALAKISSCNLFVLFPVKGDKLSRDFLGLFNSISISKVGFGNNSYHGPKGLWFYLKLILSPWLFSKHELILNADYFVSNAYKGNKLLSQIIYNLATYSSVYYSFLLYKMGYRIPVRALERKKQLDCVYQYIVDDLEDGSLLWLDFSTLLPLFNGLIQKEREYKVVVNAHNIEFLLLERLAEVATTDLARTWLKLQAHLLKQEELKGYSNADLVIVCSDHDKQVIQKHIKGVNIEVIPNGVDLDYFHFNPESKLTSFPSLLFTGTMGYFPNKDAVLHFITDIFPLVKKVLPNCKFVIAGANAARVFSDYLDRNDVIIHSSPEDMRPIYSEAWIVVVPLRTGSGTRLKILEAMAMGKPTISTSVGAEGIDVENDKEILIAENEDEFLEQICKLIEDNLLYKKLQRGGLMRVQEKYNWACIQKTIGETILRV